MNRITTLNSQRLQWCLSDLGATVQEAARTARTTPARLQAVLDGDGSLTFHQLQHLATFTGRSVLFLIDPAPVEPEDTVSAQYRTLARQKPGLTRRVRQLVQRVERQRATYQALLEDDDGTHPAFDPPHLPTDPIEAAIAVRRWLGLDPQASPTFETCRAAVQARGVLVLRAHRHAGRWQIDRTDTIEGFALYDPVTPTVVVGAQAAGSGMAFTLMHHLGHLLLHRASSIGDHDDLRATTGPHGDANRFATRLLARDATTADTVPTARHRASGPAHRSRDPRTLFGDRYVHTVLAALSARRITLKRAGDHLGGLTVDDLRKLERSARPGA